MKKLLYFLLITSLLLAIYFIFREPVRFGTYGDDIRTATCTISNTTYDKAPIERYISLTGTHLLTEPITDDVDNWGNCPYQNYKVKTAAAELWIIAGLSGLALLVMRRKKNTVG